MFSLRISTNHYGDLIVELETIRRTMGGFWMRARKRWLSRPRNPENAAWTKWELV